MHNPAVTRMDIKRRRIEFDLMNVHPLSSKILSYRNVKNNYKFTLSILTETGMRLFSDGVSKM